MAGTVELGRNELEARLLEFDRAVSLTHPGRAFRLVLVGGGALVLLGCLARSTSDLDALEAPRELVALMEQYDINPRVSAYINNFAYNFEDRIVPLDLGTKSVTCFAASLEDVVASKLCSPREIDEFDVRRPEVLEALDWNRLDEIVNDMHASRLNDRRYSELLSSYEAYREECSQCDN